jgi:hypothetical protein
MMAEVIHHFLPKLVDIHNYPSASNQSTKEYNWATMNKRVFKKMGFILAKEDIDDILGHEPGVIEKVLRMI